MNPWTRLARYAAPREFLRYSVPLGRWLGRLSLALFAAGLYGGLVLAPADYLQGDSFRIIYVHVPGAWMSLLTYLVMTAAGVIALVWNSRLAAALARNSAPLGAAFTMVALGTGMIWGKPTWGTWWVWDARLTSELILLFLYLGYMGLQAAIEDRRAAARASAVLALVGVVNIPIIHYSVVWWNTLHQGPTVSRLGAPAITWPMLAPLLLIALAFLCYYLAVVIHRMRCDMLEEKLVRQGGRA